MGSVCPGDATLRRRMPGSPASTAPAPSGELISLGEVRGRGGDDALGLGAVLGNGVATEIGCWMEACVGAQLLTTAGEMNGFLKQRQGLLTTPLRVERGSIQLNRAAMPQLDPGAVAAARVAREDFRISAGNPATVGGDLGKTA